MRSYGPGIRTPHFLTRYAPNGGADVTLTTNFTVPSGKSLALAFPAHATKHFQQIPLKLQNPGTFWVPGFREKLFGTLNYMRSPRATHSFIPAMIPPASVMVATSAVRPVRVACM